jgi:uncharacterized membrane-anchored protein
MGLREVVLIAWVGGLGVVAVAAADPRPAKPAKVEAKVEAEDAKAKAQDAKPAAGDPAVEAAGAPADESAESAESTLPPHIEGPKLVDLGNHTEIDLPGGMILLERTEAQKLLREMGSSPEGTVAIVIKLGSSWTVHIDYDDAGYIDDSDAADLDAGELLESYREGTRQQNATRKSLGKPEIVIDDWSERPRYERAQRQLVWGIAGHVVEHKVINFFTRILGRNGFLSVNLIAAPEEMDAAKKEALAVLQATRFKAGSRYEDHASSDKSSGIGLRGLVLGGAGVAVASKLGFLAKILLIFKKGVIVIFMAIGGLFRWLFRRKPQGSPVSDSGGDPLQGAGGPPPGGPDDTGAAG